MWTHEDIIETETSVAEVYALFSDVTTWPEWNAGLLRVELDGPFEAGTWATMVMPDEERIPFRLIWIEAGRGFEDETQVPDANVVVRVRHTVDSVGEGRVRITYRCVVEGPGAAEAGQMVTADFPQVLAALSARAKIGA